MARLPCVDADGEAEATCAALAAAGACDFVATTDVDALLFGAGRVLRNLDINADGLSSRCELWDSEVMERTAGVDQGALIAAAFLIGSDYDVRPSQSQSQRWPLRAPKRRTAIDRPCPCLAEVLPQKCSAVRASAMGRRVRAGVALP